MPTGNDKLQDRAGANAADKPGYSPFNGFFGAREGVLLDHVSGDIEVVPTPPPGVVRILEDFVTGQASFGQVSEITSTLTGNLIWQDINGNEFALENVVGSPNEIKPTNPLTSQNRLQHLVNGERIIFRPAAAGTPGEALFTGAWRDTDLNATRGDLSDTLQVVAQPPRGKTWSIMPGPIQNEAPFRVLVFWNFDSIAHTVRLFLNDGTNDIPISGVAGIGPVDAWNPAGPFAGEGYSVLVQDAGLVIPDGCSLKANMDEASAGGRCLLLAPFSELNASKLANSPSF